ncbi:MAG: Outer membrane protein [uncultured Sphingomonas sp.]|uniref:Outer membrane protein n=1 Tax=uncultured Sphingomonas sp. TaxID=158754 RepID=A0A6J4T558_9SPHN|nr:MAG: Outer membrane protein [uncultured Sphingomonas sp.]
MKHALLAALLAGAVPLPAAAQAQQAVAFTQPISGTRLEISATGDATRVPDIAIISAGVITRAATAKAALAQNAAQMERVRAALKRAGIADRDIQTANINLNPEYRYVENQPPGLTGYSASNQLNVRFRDIASTGDILDALVAQGANQINGPTLSIDKPEAALDEARTKALAVGRARAELYGRSLGMRVVRLLSVSETGREYGGPRPMVMMERGMAASADTKIDPGEQKLEVTLAITFELQ